MCGIAGSIDFSLGATRPDGLNTRMAQCLSRRGPDCEGGYEDRLVNLVHRRLIVVDSDGGSQPMYSPDGNIILIYNGELYNTQELREHLIKLGHTFTGYSDTEVVLHAYLAWGTDAFQKFNGIYAFALWDKQAECLTLCRDRLGVKPLFYARRGELLVFGSEIKALFCHPAIQPQLDEDGLRTLLLLGPARPPYSGVFHGIDSVLPGQYITFHAANGLQKHFYWKLTAKEHTDTLEQTIEHTRCLVEDAAKRQLVSDVPVCTFLSGGLDSSILSMLAARTFREHGETLHTFSVDYRDNEKYFTQSIFEPNYDNTYIDQMADFLGTTHHKIVLEQPDLVRTLPQSMPVICPAWQMLTLPFSYSARQSISRALPSANLGSVPMNYLAATLGITTKRCSFLMASHGLVQQLCDAPSYMMVSCETAKNSCAPTINAPATLHLNWIRTAQRKRVCGKCSCSICNGLWQLFSTEKTA